MIFGGIQSDYNINRQRQKKKKFNLIKKFDYIV